MAHVQNFKCIKCHNLRQETFPDGYGLATICSSCIQEEKNKEHEDLISSIDFLEKTCKEEYLETVKKLSLEERISRIEEKLWSL